MMNCCNQDPRQGRDCPVEYDGGDDAMFWTITLAGCLCWLIVVAAVVAS
jgi:hypothetical protein